MRIIKSGKLKNKIIKCTDCECEFEYELTDIVKICLNTAVLTYPYRYQTNHCVYCPECGKEHYLYSTFKDQTFENITLVGGTSCQGK